MRRRREEPSFGYTTQVASDVFDQVQIDEDYGDRDAIIQLVLNMMQPATVQPAVRDDWNAFLNPLDHPDYLFREYRLSRSSVGANKEAIARHEPRSFLLEAEWLGPQRVMSTRSARANQWYIFMLPGGSVSDVQFITRAVLAGLQEPIPTLSSDERALLDRALLDQFEVLMTELFGFEGEAPLIHLDVRVGSEDATLLVGLPASNRLCAAMMAMGEARVMEVVSGFIASIDGIIRVDGVTLDEGQSNAGLPGELVVEFVDEPRIDYRLQSVCYGPRRSWCDFIFDIQGRSSADVDAPGEMGAMQAKRQFEEDTKAFAL